MKTLNEQVKSYKYWCKIKNLVPSDFKNLTKYCDIMKGRTYPASAKHLCLSK